MIIELIYELSVVLRNHWHRRGEFMRLRRVSDEASWWAIPRFK